MIQLKIRFSLSRSPFWMDNGWCFKCLHCVEFTDRRFSHCAFLYFVFVFPNAIQTKENTSHLTIPSTYVVSCTSYLLFMSLEFHPSVLWCSSLFTSLNPICLTNVDILFLYTGESETRKAARRRKETETHPIRVKAPTGADWWIPRSSVSTNILLEL